MVIEENANIKVIRASDAEGALEKIKELIHKGAEAMNGSSTTFKEIGRQNLLNRGCLGWKNL